MMREIVLDTETTGLRPEEGHRIVEIGCVELVNHVPTGRTFQAFLNPERLMEAKASEISGITDAMLVGQPLFADIAQSLIDFIGDAPIVAHNAPFDMGFLNAEFSRIGLATMPPERAIDTVMIARRKFPGAPASLDALCKRFNIDLSERVKHGALLDARLLADVYLELCGGRQFGLSLQSDNASAAATSSAHGARPEPLETRLTEEELAAHAAFLEGFKTTPIWKQYA
jgi:DNA polymerase-3 subunit epsilon